jgi:hypothetical protein
MFNFSIYGIVKILLVFIVFMATLYIAPYYTGGDQIPYTKAYEGLYGLDIKEGYIFYSYALSSLEFVHFISSWVFSNLQVDKSYFISLINSIFAYALISLLQKWRVSIFIISMIILTNFYIIMLYFAAERLKFAVLFLFLSLFYINKKKFLFGFLSIVSHVQLIILYGSIVFNYFLDGFIKFLTTMKFSKSLLILMILIMIPIFIMSEQIEDKFSRYSNVSGFQELLKSFIFFLMAAWYSKNKRQTLYIFIPILISVYLVGGDRINMMSYFIFMYYALQVNKGLNIGVIATSLYFFLQSIIFIDNIFTYGNGFYRL